MSDIIQNIFSIWLEYSVLHCFGYGALDLVSSVVFVNIQQVFQSRRQLLRQFFNPFFLPSSERNGIYVLGNGEFSLFPYQYFFRSSAGREFFKKLEHFSHSIVYLLALRSGVFEVGLRCRNSLDQLDEFFCVIPALMVVEGEVFNDFPRFVGILIAEFAAGGMVNLAFKMKGYMIIKNLDLKPTIDAMMRDFLE
nr:hypothetical protein [Tanacetum cinerariifolium]